VRVSIDARTSQWSTERLSDERGLFDKLALALLEDKEGNVWVGTSGGLLRFYEPKSRTYSRVDGLPDNNVRAIEATSNGDIWIGTASGLAKMTSGRIAPVPQVPGLNGRAVTSLHADGSGTLFIGFADSGLGTLSHDRFSRIETPGEAVRDNNVLTVRPDARGGFWVCNLQDMGLYYGRSQSTFRKVQGIFNPGRGGCGATLLDRHGRIWIGFDDGSLMVQAGDGEPQFLRGEGTPHGRVCALHEDGDESIWIATTAGLSRYKNGEFSTIDARNGLPSDYFSALIEDDSGDLWVSSISGIIRLPKQQFEMAVGDPGYRVRYTLYDSADGVSDTPVCYGEPHAARDRDGKLWFTSLSGAVVIDPVRMRDPSAAFSPRIERLVADDVVLAADSTSLPARTAKVEIDYTAISLSAASKVRFQYRLDGFDTSWVEAGTRRQAFYTNLGPRHYRFQVRASVNEAAGPAVSHEFDVQPAFYQTWSFYGMVGVVAIVLVWGAWQLRVHALHERYALIMDERTRIGREIHDTVLQDMAGVALRLEGVSRQAQTQAGVREALTAISSEIKEHIAEIRHTILELRTSDEGTANLEAALEEACGRIERSTSTRCELTVTGTPPPRIGHEVSRELLRIAREALRNAVRHAGATHIRIELSYTDDALHLVVRDDGQGFNVEEHLAAESDHWGLLGMKERATRIGGQFDIRSGDGTGTAVETSVRYERAV
jgi:signal transduction histidine kinase